MWNKNLLALAIMTSLMILGCKSKVNHIEQSPIAPYLLDTNYIKQDLCECYMNNGYSRNITDTSCYFGDGSVSYHEWWQQILDVYANSTEEKPFVIKVLLSSDNRFKRRLKQYCFGRRTFSRFAPEYFVAKIEVDTNDISESITSKRVRNRLNVIKSNVLLPWYKSAGIHKESIVPLDDERSQLSVVTVDFENGSIEIDYIFALDTILASDITNRVGKNILKDQWLSENLNYLSYPLTYWELDQLSPTQ